MGLNKLESFCTAKETVKTMLRMGQDICKWRNWQGANLWNMQIAHAAQYIKKTNSPIKKRAEDLDISPKKAYRWPKSTGKDTQYHCY